MTYAGLITDIKRERRIKRLSAELATCAEETRGEVWDRLKAEVNARSDRQVKRMEKARGLQGA